MMKNLEFEFKRIKNIGIFFGRKWGNSCFRWIILWDARWDDYKKDHVEGESWVYCNFPDEEA